jgi:hypothetical protein
MPSGTNQDFAIFSRNHKSYLEEARRRERDEWTTFRSNVRWVTAGNAVKANGPCKIYFAAIDDDGTVNYEAELVHVQIDPRAPSAETRRLLSKALKSTTKEKLWDNAVRTLYVIANCKRLDKPFSQTKLRKFNDNKPLDKNYMRSYALVHPV